MSQGMSVLFIILILSMSIGYANGIGVSAPAYGQAYEMAKETAGQGKLVGKVVRGPISPVVREGMNGASESAPDVKLVIITPAGREIGTTTTNEQGVFSISLPPDTYRIETTSLKGMEFSKDLPATVVITEGRETRLDIHIDTGMR